MSDSVVIALISIVPTTIAALGAWWARDARQQATGANQAVNAVAPGEDTLKDRVTHIEDRQGEMCRTLTRIEYHQHEMANQHLEIRAEVGRLAGFLDAHAEGDRRGR